MKNSIWWWRQHWRGVTISTHTSERRSVSKSRELKRTTDFTEGDKLVIWSTNMFVQRGPVTKFKAYRGCSVSNWRTTTFRTLIYNGSKHYYEQVIFHRTMSWKDCTSPSCKIPVRFRQLWHFSIKKFCEEETKEIITDWGYVWNFILSNLKEIRISGFRTKIQSVEPWPKEGDKILSWSGRQENVFSGKQMGFVQVGDSCSRETRHQPWVTASMEGRTKSKHPLLDWKWEIRPTWKAQEVKRQVWRLGAKILVQGVQNVKNRRLFIGILPCVIITGLETNAFMAIVASVDILMVRRSPARGRKKRVLKEQLRFWDKI